MSDRLKLSVLGGSALATPLLFEGMAKANASTAYDAILYGRDAERLDLVTRVSNDILSHTAGADIRVRATQDLDEAVDGASFIVNQMRIGGLEGRLFDETFPRAFGLPGEETVGPGGFNNTRRGLPVVLDACRRIEQRAPKAVLLNLTNPSSLIQYAIRRYTKVNVIGTCDSPVALMKMLAGLLGIPREEVTFALSGMHHFTWITGVVVQGRERLPEILARADELPKLGTDPELIRTLGAIPSPYYRYYAHPDRILAMTEGRPVRAQELMALQDQMLAEFRRWKPGEKIAALSTRGAVWYDEIVVPTLLALAEHKTLELVLSVDNGDTLPWLAPQAIIEAPVPIRGGTPGKPRAADLPEDIRALIHRNAAYEALAVEAIVENDRAKALRALMSNLLVRSYNQAHGLLDVIWPEEARAAVSIQRQSPKGEESMKVPTLHYGDQLLESARLPEDDIALITMEEPWELARDRLGLKPKAIAFVRELDWFKLEALERDLPEVAAIVGLGGGTPTDAAKYVAWRRHLPVDLFPSITSVDAAVTKSIAARSGGHVTYIGYVVPRQVYVDTKLIAAAPPRLNRSGVGDILCAHTALWDWKLAHDSRGERYDPAAVEVMQRWLERILAGADDIRDVTPDGIRLIMQAFEDISLICRRFGSSRPQEASDHTFAYNAEFQTGRSFLHGELVGLGTYAMASLQNNDPAFLLEAYQRMGLLWQPRDIGLTRDEFVRTLRTLNAYQKNFGRRYSILDERKISEVFIESMAAGLAF
jgi:6-phospho-beta-glucosidase